MAHLTKPYGTNYPQTWPTFRNHTAQTTPKHGNILFLCVCLFFCFSCLFLFSFLYTNNAPANPHPYTRLRLPPTTLQLRISAKYATPPAQPLYHGYYGMRHPQPMLHAPYQMLSPYYHTDSTPKYDNISIFHPHLPKPTPPTLQPNH
jgi:hypothetical protein